jgi:protein-S-isoprenylcysteine O-methyltransferase Ste14
MRALELKIPPPVVLAACAALVWLTAPAAGPRGELRVALTALVAVTGFLVEAAAGMRFVQAGTTVNPMRPERSSALVTTGLHAWSRNPMYVGQLLLLAAWALWRGGALSPLWLVAYAAYVTRFQIIPEERVLSATFGADYGAYRARVRRWL